jgi:hypothetical protein
MPALLWVCQGTSTCSCIACRQASSWASCQLAALWGYCLRHTFLASDFPYLTRKAWFVISLYVYMSVGTADCEQNESWCRHYSQGGHTIIEQYNFLPPVMKSWCSSVSVVSWLLQTGWPGFNSWQRQRIFPLVSVFRPALMRPTQPPIQWVLVVLFPGAKRSLGMTLTTNANLVLRQRMSRSYISSPPKYLYGIAGQLYFTFTMSIIIMGFYGLLMLKWPC